MIRSQLLHDRVGVPDPLRRSPIPRDLDAVSSFAAETDPAEVGMTKAGVERIWQQVRSLYKSGIHPAIAVCIRRDGQVVMDRAIGHARGNGPADRGREPKVLATPETPFCIFSATKGTTATLVHKLDEEGLLHIGDPVAAYLPEFAANRKSKITIAQVLSHRAGIPNLPPEALDLDLVNDWEAHRRIMAGTKPISRPGKFQAYHAVSGGTVLGEVIREVTGQDIREVLADRFLDPLGFRWMNYGVAAEDVDKVAYNYPTGPLLVPPLSTHITRALGVHPDAATRLSNDPRFLTGVLPAANGVSTANELSRFYEMLRCGGELDGVRVMEERTIHRAVLPQSHLEIDRSLGLPISFSYGYMLGAKAVSLYGPGTPRAFGHLGWINVLGWADPQRKLSVGIITTGKAVLYPELPRLWNLLSRIGQEAAPSK